MKNLVLFSMLLLLTSCFSNIEREESFEDHFEVHENVERNTPTWYDFGDELPLEKQGKWNKTLTKDNKTYIIISGGYEGCDCSDLNVSDVDVSDQLITIKTKLINNNEGDAVMYTPISIVIIDKPKVQKDIEVVWQN
ncbi:hypothetical protein [Alkalihalobacillus sp. AL-G]|uniref:hypothetical protein n=1 Tax=Alkalihalobacillus sp. AL-G TaxID=2926399 RepID=UPI00272D96E6|nr:hypothetical protein [Alkalihalobacillus sp. AL-G]WLD94377.1 hypothetical protein MOJ78_05685 [Alkalihalobacillus sp. AL-G]